MSLAPSSAATLPPLTGGKKMPEIVTIPDQFYGVALKLDAMTRAEREAASIPAPVPVPQPVKPVVVQAIPEKKRLPWAMIGVVAGVVLLSIGGFVYFNRKTLFGKPPAVVVTPVVVPATPPLAPSGLSTTASQGAVSLAWTDASNDEQGYHIQRRVQADGSPPEFIRITTLPANSTAFIDVTVTPATTYVYQVIATGPGGDSAASNDSAATVPELPAAETPKPTFPPGGLDRDSDGLTDVEETVYGTNNLKPDTDDDRYLDGNEVFHLYNPLALAPGKLLDSGVVRSLTSTSGWTLYIPTVWTTSPDQADPNKLLIQTGKGEYLSITVESNPSKQELIPWVAARINAAPETFGAFTTKGGLSGIYSEDRMQAWLSWGDAVFHISYDLNGQPFVNFRTTLEMMLNSMRLDGVAVLPSPFSPSTSGPGSLLSPPPEAASSTADTATSTSEMPVLELGTTTSTSVTATSTTPTTATTTSTAATTSSTPQS